MSRAYLHISTHSRTCGVQERGFIEGEDDGSELMWRWVTKHFSFFPSSFPSTLPSFLPSFSFFFALIFRYLSFFLLKLLLYIFCTFCHATVLSFLFPSYFLFFLFLSFSFVFFCLHFLFLSFILSFFLLFSLSFSFFLFRFFFFLSFISCLFTTEP